LFKTFCGIIGPGMTYVVVFSVIILSTIVLSRVLEQKSILDPVLSRKVLHIVAVGLSAVSVFYIETMVLQFIALCCLPILIVAVSRGFFRDPQTGRKSWGIVYFNLVFALLLYFFSGAPDLIFYPLLILAFGDGLAAVIGVSLGKKNGKTLQGFTAFFLATLTVLLISPKFYPVSVLPLETALILSFSLACVEFITNKSLDNLTVPAAAVYWLYVDHLSGEAVLLIFPAILLGCWLIFKFKWLSREGSVLAGIIALVYLSSPFPEALIPGIIFFTLGSILSKIPGGGSKEESRSAMQVFSNGGPALISICIYFTTSENAWFLASIVSFSVALSDTTSSEIGMRFSSKTFDIIGLRNLKKGASGGISFIGLCAGVLAALFLALSTAVFISLTQNQIWLIACLGFGGNLLDSLIGSLAQSKYFQNSTSLWSDEKTELNQMQAGFSWFDNNLTNLISISSLTILSYFIF